MAMTPRTKGPRVPQFAYMRAPGGEHDFQVGDTVEVYCDHEKNKERVRGWIRGIVVQVDNKMVAVQFRSNVFLTDGWMVPDRILWYPLNSEHIRPVAKKSSQTRKGNPGLLVDKYTGRHVHMCYLSYLCTCSTSMLDVNEIRKDFPIFQRETKPGTPLVYLDSTATSQKPLAVIEAMDNYYRRSNANIHRGVHTLAEEATALYEQARVKIAKFINAPSAHQIIYTRNTTESINLVAYSWARANLKAGDLVILTEMEHHSNLVPWQILQAERGIELDFIPVTEDGLLDLDAYKTLLSRGPKLVSFTHMSNVLGTINPAAEIIRLAHEAGAVTLVDAAQSVPHLKVDVQALDADFLAFSAHKMCGPTGIGMLYGKMELLEAMPPFLGGGDMIKEVKLRSFRANALAL